MNIVLAILGLAAAAVFAGIALRLSAKLRRSAERPEGERHLATECALLRNTIESIGDGLAAFDQSGQLVLWNDRFLEMLDLPRGQRNVPSLREILMRQALRGDFGAGEPTGQVQARADAFFRDGAAALDRFNVAGRTLQMQRRPILGGVVVALYSDITDRKAAEEKLTQAWAEAELGNRAKSEFLANMSHELRTPLNAIIGFSEVISSQILGPVNDAKHLEYIRDIHASGMHLLAIVNDVLDMSKIEAGKLELRRVPVDIGPVIAESVRMVRERADSRGIRLTIDRGVEDLVVAADERAIRQITLNLLSNAVKFSHDKGEIAIHGKIENDGSFLLEIEDCGIGMTSEGIQRALQPFGQANSAASRTQSGTGLGLPITKGLVEAHGGDFTIDSSPGWGTVVRVFLPAAVEVLAPKPRAAPLPRSWSPQRPEEISTPAPEVADPLAGDVVPHSQAGVGL
jgi:signal transduction histidine kinase